VERGRGRRQAQPQPPPNVPLGLRARDARAFEPEVPWHSGGVRPAPLAPGNARRESQLVGGVYLELQRPSTGFVPEPTLTTHGPAAKAADRAAESAFWPRRDDVLPKIARGTRDEPKGGFPPRGGGGARDVRKITQHPSRTEGKGLGSACEDVLHVIPLLSTAVGKIELLGESLAGQIRCAIALPVADPVQDFQLGFFARAVRLGLLEENSWPVVLQGVRQPGPDVGVP
jgi:hypothetical protein